MQIKAYTTAGCFYCDQLRNYFVELKLNMKLLKLDLDIAEKNLEWIIPMLLDFHG